MEGVAAGAGGSDPTHDNMADKTDNIVQKANHITVNTSSQSLVARDWKGVSLDYTWELRGHA